MLPSPGQTAVTGLIEPYRLGQGPDVVAPARLAQSWFVCDKGQVRKQKSLTEIW